MCRRVKRPSYQDTSTPALKNADWSRLAGLNRCKTHPTNRQQRPQVLGPITVFNERRSALTGKQLAPIVGDPLQASFHWFSGGKRALERTLCQDARGIKTKPAGGKSARFMASCWRSSSPAAPRLAM